MKKFLRHFLFSERVIIAAGWGSNLYGISTIAEEIRDWPSIPLGALTVTIGLFWIVIGFGALRLGHGVADHRGRAFRRSQGVDE